MSYLGDFLISALVDLKFTTVNTSGVPTALAGSPAISVYQKGNTTPSTSGVTLTVNYNSTTGLNDVTIDLSSNTGFYLPGFDYQVVITTGTVGGSSVVGYVVGEFSILNRYAGKPLVRGVVGSGSTVNSIVTSSLTPAVTSQDQFKGRIVIFDTNTATAGLQGEGASVQTNTAGGVLTVDTLTNAPVSGDAFAIY